MILIHYGPGCIMQGILLSLHGGTLRVACKGSDDTQEFILSDGAWYSTERQRVTFEFPLALLSLEALGVNEDQQALFASRQGAGCKPVN